MALSRCSLITFVPWVVRRGVVDGDAVEVVLAMVVRPRSMLSE
jgi:hypothetical protein